MVNLIWRRRFTFWDMMTLGWVGHAVDRGGWVSALVGIFVGALVGVIMERRVDGHS